VEIFPSIVKQLLQVVNIEAAGARLAQVSPGGDYADRLRAMSNTLQLNCQFTQHKNLFTTGNISLNWMIQA